MERYEIESVGRTDIKLGTIGGLLLLLYPIPSLLAPQAFSGVGLIAVLYQILLFVPVAMITLGIIGLHNHVDTDTGSLELVGYFVAVVGSVILIFSFLLLYIINQGQLTFLTAIIRDTSFFLVVLGLGLVGIDCWQSNALFKIGSGLFVISILGFPVSFYLIQRGFNLHLTAVMIPFGFAWAVTGYHILSETTE